MKLYSKIKLLWEANSYFIRNVCKYYWPIFIFQTISIVLSGFSPAITSKMSHLFVSSITFTGDLKDAMKYIIFWLIYTFFMSSFQLFGNTYLKYVNSKLQILIKENISSKIANLKLSFFDIPENKNILSRAVKYAENGGFQLLNYIFSLMVNILGIWSIICILNPFSWWIAFFLIILSIYKMIVDFIISKINHKFQKDKTLLDRRIKYFGNILTNHIHILEYNIYNIPKFFLNKYNLYQNQSISFDTKQSIKINILNISVVIVIILQNFFLYLYIGIEMINGNISVADFTMFFTAINYFNSLLTNLRKSFSSFIPMVLEAQNYIEFLNISDDYKYYILNVDKKIHINEIESIEFRNVSFAYPQKKEYAIKNISFIIKPGDTISLVGTNGSGKSTLIKLLLGLYPVNEGEILVNSIPLDKIDIKSYWHCCGILFQEYSIYSLPAYENITFDETHSKNIDDILKQNGLYKRFEKEKNGIFTELSRDFDNEGTQLSGGEKQKIAFSRVCFFKRNLVLLDEPSCSLDAQSEYNMFKSIDNLKSGQKIIIFVSHRLSSSIYANKILFLQNGKLIKEGDHNYLMHHCHEYKELFITQAKTYLET